MKVKRIYVTGFSLVEMMVAMVIGLFLTLGIFAMFNMSSANIKSTSGLNQLQENGRMALTILSGDIEQLGFFADMTGTEFLVGVNTDVLVTLKEDCNIDNINNGSFPINNAGYFRQLWGYEIGKSTETLKCNNTDLKGFDETDVLQIKRLSGPNTLNPTETNKIYMGISANEAKIFAGSQSSPIFEHARYWEYKHHVYYINNDSDGIPLLRRKSLTANGMTNNEQLVEGIENMRFLYGFDTNEDGSADNFVAVNKVTNDMWDHKGKQRLVAIRVYILVRAIEADGSYLNNVTYTLGDKSIAATGDHYRRKVLSTTVPLENPLLIRN